ncbi:QueT transporter family protein [Oceanotoga teriensis]|uniref:QueT transporter family protein n=1 Tax=Oceanotoga teriensis TaxID=515440 RepID=UPI002712D739|nr:QueT transporter family protein [Oceanotoga teriensis]MDO7977576.1 QueT transporter family protein [Oceanotoga teriensis]
MKNNTKRIVNSGVVAAVYVVLCILFQPISFGSVQFRIAEAFTVLPFLDAAFIPGLYIGVLLANIIGGLGAWDIWLGSFFTLIAAYLTWKMPNKWLAPLPSVLVNAFGVSAYVSVLYEVPYWISVLWIGIGQAVVTYLIGIPILILFKKHYKPS